MSYILEALKKSQQERELGQVPTLVAGPASDPRRPLSANLWGLVAVGLAALAVAIALYGALNRVAVQAPAPGPGPRTADTATGIPDAVAPAPAPLPGSAQPGPGVQAEVAPGAPVAAAGPGVAVKPALGYPDGPRGLQDQDNSSRGSLTRAEPGPPVTGHPGLAETASRGDAPPDPMEEEPGSGDWMEMDEEIGPARPGSLPPPAERPRRGKPARPALSEPVPPPIPEDLRQDVAAFKEELRREQSGSPARPAAAKAAPEDPRKLRLPPEIEARLPAFFMTAHIYDTASSKRFVVINALKYTQGETTREGLKVEDILSDGVVLSFEGHRFFRHR